MIKLKKMTALILAASIACGLMSSPIFADENEAPAAAAIEADQEVQTSESFDAIRATEENDPDDIAFAALENDSDDVSFVAQDADIEETEGALNSATNYRQIALEGTNRYQTAAAVAKAAYPEGAEEILLVTGVKFPDALSANAYAGAKNIPLLLTKASKLSDETRGLLVNTWANKVQKVTIIGAGLSEQVYKDLEAIGIDSANIRTIGGNDRYETAAKVCEAGLEEGLFTTDTCFVATGRKAADAISASTWSNQLRYPILLTYSGQLDAQTKAMVSRFSNVILLGAANVVSDSCALGKPFKRLGGNNRYTTACAIAEYFVTNGYGQYQNTFFADGTDAHFPDALCAGMLAAQKKAPILLTSNRQMDTRAFVFQKLKKDAAATDFYFIGYDGPGGGPAYRQIGSYLKATDWCDVRYLKSTTVLSAAQVDDSDLDYYFLINTIEPGGTVYNRIVNKSYNPSGLIGLHELRYLKVLHYNFNGKIQVGELICNAAIASSFISVFKQLYQARYQIKSMRLIDDFWTGDGLSSDEASIEADNTSCFCYRQASDAANLSNHSWGRAIDINPIENPYVYVTPQGSYSTHAASKPYVTNRDPSIPHVITTSDKAYQVLTAHGFTWGGFFPGNKDYQHFDKLN
ncbi:MAG: cell wall-binding repeat-containing protein [Lachnospiraceae bacterium]|nr:cell wall-binding repeat-containing protein [Lachnospiraceae bacterium]